MTREAALMVVSGGGTVVQWSREAEELLGRTATEVVGQPVARVVSRTGSASALRVVSQLRGNGAASGLELRVRPLLRADDSVDWAVFQARTDSPIPSAVGAAVLGALSAQSLMGLHVLDQHLRIVRATFTTPILGDESPEQLVGRRLTDVYNLSDPAGTENLLRTVLESGAPAREPLVRVRPKHAPGPEYVFSVSAFRLDDPDGHVLGVLAVALDVTAREKVRRRVGVLRTVRDRVGHSLDLVTTCQDLVDCLVPSFADVAVVEVVDSVARGEEPPLGPLGRDVPLRRVAARGGGARQAPAHPVGDVRSVTYPTPYAQALTDLEPRLVVLDSDAPWFAADPARAHAIRASGARVLLAAPLVLRGTVLGLLSLYRTDETDPYTEDDVQLTLDLAAHTALSIDIARRYTREHTIAVALQRGLLPAHPSSQTAVETAHLVALGDQGGGGWYDTFALPGARTALVVCDVNGQGLHAATTMGQLRTVLHSLAAFDLEPDELLARLNDATLFLAQERAARPPGDPMRRQELAAHCLYAVYDPLARACTIARAGQPPPVIAHSDGSTEQVDSSCGGPMLGSAEGPPFATTCVTLSEGDVLALGTPAILPASTPTSVLAPTPDALLQALEAWAPDRSLQELCDEVLYRLKGNTGPGDAILLLARTHTFPADHVATWPLDQDPTAAGTARIHAHRRLTDWGVDEEVGYATELIVSELVTNAVRYGSAPLSLRLIKDRFLTCEVHDTSPTTPRLRHARTIDEGGRGLFIVAQLAQNWGVRYTSDGKTVWTEQSLPTATPHPG